MNNNNEIELNNALGAIGIKTGGPDPAGRRDWHTHEGRYIGTYDAEQGWQALRDMINNALPQ